VTRTVVKATHSVEPIHKLTLKPQAADAVPVAFLSYKTTYRWSRITSFRHAWKRLFIRKLLSRKCVAFNVFQKREQHKWRKTYKIELKSILTNCLHGAWICISLLLLTQPDIDEC